MSRAYFERWARSVRSDTHRMLREEQRRQHKAKDASESKSNKAPGPGFGVAVLLDEDLVVSMETACGEFELVV